MSDLTSHSESPKVAGEPEGLFDFADRFYRFECEKELFSYSVWGRPVWQFVRYQVFQQYLDRDNDLQVVGEARWQELLSQIPQTLLGALRVVRFLLWGGKFPVVILNYNRTVNVGGAMVNAHSFFLAKSLAGRRRSLIIEPDDAGHTSDKYPSPVIHLRAFHLAAKLVSRFLPVSAGTRREMSDLTNGLEREFGVRFNIMGMVRHVMAYQIILGYMYLRILRRVKAKAAVFCHNGHCFGFINAAHRCGCRAIEYQHSVMNRLYSLNNYDPKVPKDTIRPYVATNIFTYGPYWHREFNLPAKLHAVGLPYQEWCTLREKGRVQTSPKAILVVSTIPGRPHLSKVALDLADTMPDHTVYYKLRQNEYDTWQANYPPEMTTKGNIRMIDNDDESIYFYYALCAYYIGINSTAVFEALPFGIVPFILRVGNFEEMKGLYEAGYAFLASNASEIAQQIKMPGCAKSPPNPDSIFMNDSLGRLRKAIEELVPQ